MRHYVVVVLAGMNHDLLHAGFPSGSMDRRKLRKVRARTHHVNKFHS